MAIVDVEIQSAVNGAIEGYAPLQGQFPSGVVKLYKGFAGNRPAYPHVLTGDDQVIGDDTDCGEGSEIYVKVHIYAKESDLDASYLKARMIAGYVRKALSRDLHMHGYVMTDHEFITTRHLSDPDPLIAHSVVEFRYLIDAI